MRLKEVLLKCDVLELCRYSTHHFLKCLFWESETEKLTDKALTSLLVYLYHTIGLLHVHVCNEMLHQTYNQK